MSIEAMKQALSLICSARLCEVNSMSSRQEMLRLMIEATDTLRAAIEREKPWVKTYAGGRPNYTVPPRREWQGLTDEEVSEILDREIGFNSCFGPETDFARAIEAKLKEKNT